MQTGQVKHTSTTKKNTTHDTNVREQLWKDPNPRARYDDGDDVEYQPYDREPKERSDQTQHSDAEVPHAQAHDRGPQREHHTREHEGHHQHAARVRRPLRAFVEPHKVRVLGELLLGVDGDVAGRGGGARLCPAVDAEVECVLDS